LPSFLVYTTIHKYEQQDYTKKMVKDGRDMRIPSDSEKHLRVISSKGPATHENRESSSVGSDSGGKVAKGERFLKIDKRLLTLGLNPSEILTFAYVDQFRGAKVCFASNETIGKEIGMSDRQVRRNLAKLKKQRLVRAFYEGKTRFLKTYLNTR
jgi:DNA-binding transcriptional ArsR family regulator